MKVILQEIEEQSGSMYRLMAETEPSLGELTTLTFSTTWTGAKNPNESQIKYRVHLTNEAKKRLKEIL